MNPLSIAKRVRSYLIKTHNGIVTIANSVAVTDRVNIRRLQTYYEQPE